MIDCVIPEFFIWRSPKMSQHDVIIVGGGISGMSLAHYCAKAGLKPLVMDKNSQHGRHIQHLPQGQFLV